MSSNTDDSQLPKGGAPIKKKPPKPAASAKPSSPSKLSSTDQQAQPSPACKKEFVCDHLCAQMPVNIPYPKPAQKILHPTNDVFVLKVAKVGANGDRKCKMEVELVTPKSTFTHKIPDRLDTREAQCDPCPGCICQSGPMKPKKRPIKKEN